MSTHRSPPEPLRKPNPDHTAWFLRKIWDRVNKNNEHWVGTIVGREGSGKSYTAIKIAHAVDPSFNADRVIFDVVELLKVLKNGEHDPGNFYVLDEAGVQLGRRTWQERSQILANQALQLIRSHNLGLIFTLPRMSELDSQTKGRLQAFYEVTRKEPNEYVRGKMKVIDPDRAGDSGTDYKKYPRRQDDGKLAETVVEEMGFTPPPESITEPYEERKSEFQEEFYEKTIQELEADDETEDSDKSVKDWATDIAKDGIEKVVAEHGNTGEAYINKELIRAHYDLTKSDARAVKALLEKQFDVSKDMV